VAACSQQCAAVVKGGSTRAYTLHFLQQSPAVVVFTSADTDPLYAMLAAGCLPACRYAFSLYSDAMRVQYQLDGLKAWYDEISLYNYNNPVFSSGTGHFTQMVWKSSTALGCAFMNCPTLTGWAPGRFYMVCRWVCLM
jgi:hypothetical protein